VAQIASLIISTTKQCNLDKTEHFLFIYSLIILTL